MIYARPGDTIEAILEGAPADLVGTLGVKIIDPPVGTIITPRATTGIVESAPGVYVWTTAAPATAGGYLVVWDAPPSDPAHTWTEQLQVNQLGAPASPLEGVAPTVEEVAALEHARTNAMGVELGTFTAETRPTFDEVTDLIEFAVADVLARVGQPLAEVDIPEARRLAAVQAAALIEASYFPDQLDSDRSAYRQYTALYLDGVNRLAARARGRLGAGIGSLPLTTVVAQSSGVLLETELLP